MATHDERDPARRSSAASPRAQSDGRLPCCCTCTTVRY